MSEKISLALKAGLLHDVGKVCIRATHERQRHSILGADLLDPFWLIRKRTSSCCAV